MKLHLPTSLRRSLLACFSTVQALFPTLAAGHIGGGLLAFAVSLAAVPSVQAAETSYTDASLKSLTLSANDIVTFSGTNTISDTLEMTATPITVNLTGGASLTLGSVTQGANSNDESFTHTFQTVQTDGAARGQLTVGNFGGNDCMTINFSHIDVNITNTAQIGSGSSYTLDDSSYTYGSEGSPLGAFKIRSWDTRIGSSLNLVHGSAATFFSDLVMCEMTAINMTGSSTTVNGNLIIQDGYFNDTVSERVVTLRGETPAGEGAVASSMSVTGNVRIGAGYTLKVLDSLNLTVDGDYNYVEGDDSFRASSNTTLEVGAGASAQFRTLNLTRSTTLTGGGLVRTRNAIGPEGNGDSVTIAGATTLEITEGRKDSSRMVFNLGSGGSTLTLSDGSTLLFGSRSQVDESKYLVIWSWGSNTGSTLNVTGGSELYVGGNLDMKQGTTLNVTGQKIISGTDGTATRRSSRATIAGDLITSFGGNSNQLTTRTATITGGKTVAVLGNLNIVQDGVLALTGQKTALNVKGLYHSPNANHTTLDVATDASAYFGGMNVGTAATIQGGGAVTSNGNISMAEGGKLTIQGQGTTLKLKAKAAGLAVNGNLDMKEGSVLDITGTSGSVTTITGTLNMGANNLTVKLNEGTTLAVNKLSQGDGSFTHAFVGSGTSSAIGNLEVSDFSAAERMNVSFDKVKFIISKDGTQDAQIGSGSTYTFANLGGLTFGLRGASDYKARTLRISNGLMDGSNGVTTINLNGGAAEIYGNLEMGANTELHQTLSGAYTVWGDLRLSSGGADIPADQKVVTLSWTLAPGENPWSSFSQVKGDLVFEDGFTLKLAGHMKLYASNGTYNSTGADNTTLDLDADTFASIYAMKIGKTGTIKGGGYVSLVGDLSIAEGGRLTITGPAPAIENGHNLTVGGTYNRQGSVNTTLDVRTGSTANIGFLNLADGTTLTGGGLVEANSADTPNNSVVTVADGTRLEIAEGKTDDPHYAGKKVFNVGTGSTMTLSEGSSLLYGSRDSVDANKYFVVWNWGDASGATINVVDGSDLYVGGNLDMKQGTTLNVTGEKVGDADSSSSATIAGDLITSFGGDSSRTDKTATITGGKTVSVGGDLNVAAGGTLAVTGSGTVLNVAGGSDGQRSAVEKAYTLAIGKDARITENKVLQTGETTTIAGIDGGGLYEVGSYVMNAEADATSTLALSGGVTMHITGTDNGTAEGGNGSFVLSNHGGHGDNRITIDGSTLKSEAAFSSKGNDTNISVSNGGLLQLNNGLAYYGDDHTVTLAVDGTSTLGVVGNDVSGAEHIVLNLANGATVALGAEGADRTLFSHAINEDAAAGLNLRADGVARFDAAQPLQRQTLHVLAGKGTLELHGDYVLGKLDNAIVNEGNLSITEGTTFDLTRLLNDKLDREGSLSGVHQFISGAAGASLAGYVENARIAYNGYVMNDEVTLGVNESGGGTLNFGDGHVGETLYWDGYVGTTASGDWQHGSTLWSATEGTHGDAATGMLDSVVFGLTPLGAVQEVQVGSGATNGIRNMSVTEGGYTFNGEALKLGENLTVTATGRTEFNSAVNVHGDVLMGNWENAVQGITTEVSFGADLDAANLYVWRVESGAAESSATGTYTFNNVNVSGDIDFHVNDQRMGGYNDSTPRVLVKGTLTADSMTIDGNAAMEFDGLVTVADTMTVLADNDDHNIVQLKGGSDINHLVLDEGAKVLLGKGKSYLIDTIDLGDATLRFDGYNTHYVHDGSGYTIYSTHDNATLKVASITTNKIKLLDGRKDDTTGTYHSFSLYSQARYFNFGTITDLRDFNVYTGVAVVDAGAGSAGAIHGDLRVMEAAMLDVNANNIMAADSGKVVVDNSYLHFRGTEQKLYANTDGTGNSMELDMAYVLGNSSATGLHVVLAEGAAAGVLNADFRQASDVSANVKLESGTTLNLRGAEGANLTLSGVVSGEGNINISGAGSTVTLSHADENRRLTGLVTVKNGAELTVAAQDALYGADVKLLAGGALTLETGGKFPVRLKSLKWGDPTTIDIATTINIDSIQGTNVVDATAAAIWLQDSSKKLVYAPDGALTFNFTISDGASMDRMKAYNIFAGNFDFLGMEPTVGLSIFRPSVFYYNSEGKRVQLDSSRYVRGYLQQGDNYVYYIRTRAGNIWAGEAGGNGSGTWATSGGGEVWYGMTAGERIEYDPSKDAALFVDDVSGSAAVVKLSGEVKLSSEVKKPGTAYFQAEKTQYTLTGSEGNYLAANTTIDVRGAGGLTLDLAGNADMNHAISNLYAYAGTTKLAENLAVSGETLVRYNAKLTTEAGKHILTSQYMAGGTFEKVTLGQGKIGGTADAIGIIADADIHPNTATSGVGAELEYVELRGKGTLDDVTISEGVSLADKANYTLTGVTYYDSTITMGANSSITLAEGAQIDIGGLDSEKDFKNPGSTTYTYKLLDGDNLASATGGIVPNLELNDILVDGVNLGSVKGGILTLQTTGTGDSALQPGEFKLVVTGADVMEWDPRWNEGGGPALGKTNTEDAVLYNAADTAVGGLATRYLYSNYVDKPGAENIIVGSLSREWKSSGGAFIGSLGGEKEIWVFNQGVGGFDEFVVGSYNKTTSKGVTYKGTVQKGDTHLVITGGKTDDDTITVGGSSFVNQEAESFITLHGTEEDLKRGRLVGGSWSADQTKASHVFMDGGEIKTWLVAGSYNGTVESSHLRITGGKVKLAFGGSAWDGTGSRESGVSNGAHTTITGGTIETLYGGSDHGTTSGSIELTMTGGRVTTLYASNRAGEVNGNVVLNLTAGSAKEVHAGSDLATLNGNFVVKLGSDFVFSNGNESDTKTGTVLCGGLQSGSGVTFNANYTSTLELVSENATYDFAGSYQGADATHSTKIMGFKEVLLANGVTMIVHNDAFNNDQNLVIGMLDKAAEGKSLTATVILGNYKDAGDSSSEGTRTGDITLKEGVTLRLGTSYAHDEFYHPENFPKLFVERGATFDITGFPREQAYNDNGGCISFQLHLAGYGVDDKGALFKGEGFASSSPDGKAALGRVILDGNASVNADGANIIFDAEGHKDSYIEFDRHTLTKTGSMVLRLYQSNEGLKDRELADGTTQPVRQGGTMYVQEGAVDYRKANQAKEVDYVLGSKGTLSVTLDDGIGTLSVKSLSGAGTVVLNPNTTISIHSDFNTLNSTFYKDWMDTSEKYNIYSSGGYVYGVFNGRITSEDGSPNLIKTGKGTQALLGEKSDYRGLTIIQDGTLYLMGSSHGQRTGKGSSATMTSGAAGLSSLVWERATDAENPDPVLRLGHGTVTYNDGYARGGEEMTIEVAAAPNGVGLDNFKVRRGDTNDFVDWVRDDDTYFRVDVSSIGSVNVDGLYADGEVYKAGDPIDRSRALYVSREYLERRVSFDLNTEPDGKMTMSGSVEGEQLDNARLSNGMKLDCNAYYGNGEICVAGSGLDLDLAQRWGVYVPSDVKLSPETADLLLYKASPLVYAHTVEGADGSEKTTYYNQYELKTPMGPDEINNATTSQPLRQDAMYYVRYEELNNRKAQMFTVYMTYDELAALLSKGKLGEEGTVGYKDYTDCTLVAIHRICVDATDKKYNAELAKASTVDLILGEVSTVVADVQLELEGYTVKDTVTRLSCNGYYVDDYGNIKGHYVAGDDISLPTGATQLLVPDAFKNQAWAVVKGLSPTGYEEAVYSGMLTDDGKTASHLTKRGAGTLVLDQQSIYTGDTNLEGGTLRLRGWGDLQNGMDRRGSGRFIQSDGTSLMLSYNNDPEYTRLGDQEIRELRKDLNLKGSGDSRWRNEDETAHQTAALISDVGAEVSFTLSGVLSGDGNLLHSGEGQLHISGANKYEGGTTVTGGVVYVENTTALGTTAEGASAKVVTYAGSTLVLTDGLGGTTNAGLVDKGYVRFHSNHNSIKGTVLIGGYEKGSDINAPTAVDLGAGQGEGQGSTLVMSGNGYWAENTIISKNSALVFNGSGSSNYTVDGINREVRVDQSAENRAGHLGGAGKLAVSGPAGKGLAVYFDNIGESTPGAGDSFTGGIRVEGNNSRLFFGRGDYTATKENGGIHVTGYFSRLNAEKSDITVADGGRVSLSSLGYYSNPKLNPSGTGTQGAAGIRAESVTVESGGTLAARNEQSRYIYNLADLARDIQLSTEDVLPGNRTGAAPEYSEATSGLWKNILADEVGSFSGVKEFKPYEKAYDTNLAVNKNRAASVNAQVTFRQGSCYEAYFANTRLGEGATLTLEAGSDLTRAGGEDKRILLDLSTNGNRLQWGENGIGISQIVLFTDVKNLIFKYNGKTIDTAKDTSGAEIFYAAAKDFFIEKTTQGQYLSDDTYVVYDKKAQIVYLDAALPEPTTATLSLLALAALCARRRRRK